MVRLVSRATGSVVSVDEALADDLGPEWEPLQSEEPVKAPARRKAQRSK